MKFIKYTYNYQFDNETAYNIVFLFSNHNFISINLKLTLCFIFKFSIHNYYINGLSNTLGILIACINKNQ